MGLSACVLSLSLTESAWLTETNRLMLPRDDGTLQADLLHARRPDASASNTGGRDLDAPAADQRFAARQRGRQLRRPYIFSETQVLLPHWHSNKWNVRPVGGSSILLINFGCSPHFKQRGEVGCCAGSFMPAQNADKGL